MTPRLTGNISTKGASTREQQLDTDSFQAPVLFSIIYNLYMVQTTTNACNAPGSYPHPTARNVNEILATKIANRFYRKDNLGKLLKKSF